MAKMQRRAARFRLQSLLEDPPTCAIVLWPPACVAGAIAAQVVSRPRRSKSGAGGSPVAPGVRSGGRPDRTFRPSAGVGAAARTRSLRRRISARHHRRLDAGAAALLCFARQPGDPLLRRGRASRLHLDRHPDGRHETRVALMAAAAPDAAPAPRSAAVPRRRPRESARRARHVSRRHALPHPWLERAEYDRSGGLVGMHPDDQ